MFSPGATLVFTAIFLVTGGYALVRIAQLLVTRDRDGSRVGELAHLLMSLGMLAMTWGVTGGVLEVVAFGVLTVWFVRRLLLPAGHERHVEAYHAAMSATMVWMLAAMPALMASGDDAGSHHHGGSAMPFPTGAVTFVLVVVSLAAAAFWLVRIVRPVPGEGCAPAVLADAGSVAVAARPVVATVGSRLDAGCHLLMSLGMAGMLLAM
ncbi:DUF5134 domain-containing protein [Actinomycetospora sp. NBRC 106378]|uniref:DUF5134 domain-containing protein n=1 Tax=Actinomycetospora sp. NBRC 106378 TaxID=3032208 RepID=UPI0024A5F8C1|nr:DUF5134 domain-containing protein [Actinomycetospora sp. NBRC 106378]GLZ54553.1 hypothetical protein Acsp07_41700 [Actinomycetospora sp. NBRC 106378]